MASGHAHGAVRRRPFSGTWGRAGWASWRHVGLCRGRWQSWPWDPDPLSPRGARRELVSRLELGGDGGGEDARGANGCDGAAFESASKRLSFLKASVLLETVLLVGGRSRKSEWIRWSIGGGRSRRSYCPFLTSFWTLPLATTKFPSLGSASCLLRVRAPGLPAHLLHGAHLCGFAAALQHASTLTETLVVIPSSLYSQVVLLCH